MSRSATATAKGSDKDTLRQDPVTRDDLEAKMRELQGNVSETASSASSALVVVGAVAAVGVVAVVFLLGRRSGKKKTTVVEIRRV
jgi:hypothetical protein